MVIAQIYFYYSRTPDRYFLCFYPCEKKRTAARQHVDPLRDCNVKITSPCCSHLSDFQDFWKSLNKMRYLNSGEQEKNPLYM